ncbi:MAG: copper resistance protein NlpE N-terminal domain-containing protein [Alphaproteobacteria bacterium]
MKQSTIAILFIAGVFLLSGLPWLGMERYKQISVKPQTHNQPDISGLYSGFLPCFTCIDARKTATTLLLKPDETYQLTEKTPLSATKTTGQWIITEDNKLILIDNSYTFRPVGHTLQLIGTADTTHRTPASGFLTKDSAEKSSALPNHPD